MSAPTDDEPARGGADGAAAGEDVVDLGDELVDDEPVEVAAGDAGGAGESGGADVAVARPPARRSRWRLAGLVGLLGVAVVLALVVAHPWRRHAAVEVGPAPSPPPGPLFPIDRPIVPAPPTGQGSERLAGVVVDGLGQPVGGVAISAAVESVVAAPTGQGAPAPPADDAGGDAGVAAARVAIAISDGNGRFALEGLAAGRYRLDLAGAGVFTAAVRFVPVPTDELRLVLARRVAIVGRVQDGGAGTPGVVIAIDGDSIGEVRTTLSADDGSFGFADLPEGTYRVWGGKEDLAARAQAAPRLGRGPFADVELYLEPATIVVGKVVDRQTGAGLAAAVMLSPEGDDAGDAASDDDTGDEAPRFARTDSAGVFRIEGVPHGRWTADAWAPGWIAAGSVDFLAGRAMPTIELTPGAVIEGKVVDGDDRPVAGVSVSARTVTGAREVSAAAADEQLRRFSGHAPRLVAASFAGVVAAPDDTGFVPRGELGVMLGPIPYPPAAGTGVVRTAAIVEPAAPGAGSGSGSAAGSGSGPAARLGVSPSAVAPLASDPAYEPTWTTGADGVFRLTGVGAGSWIAYGIAAGHPPARSRRLALRVGQTLGGVELRLASGLDVAGRVTNQRGEPVAGALLAFSPDDDDRDDGNDAAGAPGAMQTVTDAAGRYRAGPLAGPIRIEVSAFGHADLVARLELPASARDHADVLRDFVLVVADAELTGVVDDPSGLPVVGARVEVDGGPADGRAGAAGPGGRWTIAMLPPGPLTVKVDQAGYPVQRFPATPGTEARLTLAYGGGLEGVVFDHHTGENLEGIAVTATGPGGVQRDVASDGRGRLVLVPLPPGSWTLRVKTPGYIARSITALVPAGDRPGQATVRDLRLELERGALVAGTVHDRQGNRVVGARVTIERGDDEVSATTDADGEFRLRDAPTGKLYLQAKKGDLAARVPLELRAGDERLSVDVELR